MSAIDVRPLHPTRRLYIEPITMCIRGFWLRSRLKKKKFTYKKLTKNKGVKTFFLSDCFQ